MGTVLSVVVIVVLAWFFIYGFWKGWIKMFIKMGLFLVSFALAYFLLDSLLYPMIGGFNCFWSSGNTFEQYFINTCTEWITNMIPSAAEAVPTSSLTEEACKTIAVNQAGLPEMFWSKAWANMQSSLSGTTAVPAEVIGHGMGIAVTRIFVFVVSFLIFRIALGIVAFVILFIINIIIRYRTARGPIHRLIAGAFGLMLGAAVIVAFNLVMHVYASVEPLTTLFNFEESIGVNNESESNLAKWIYNATDPIANAIFKTPDTPDYPDPSSSNDSSDPTSSEAGSEATTSEGSVAYLISLPAEDVYTLLAA